MAKRNRTNNDLQSMYTHKAKDRVTRTPLKTEGEPRCSGREGSSCSGREDSSCSGREGSSCSEREDSSCSGREGSSCSEKEGSSCSDRVVLVFFSFYLIDLSFLF